MEEIVLALAVFNLVQFWLWLFLLRQTGRRLSAIESRITTALDRKNVDANSAPQRKEVPR